MDHETLGVDIPKKYHAELKERWPHLFEDFSPDEEAKLITLTNARELSEKLKDFLRKQKDDSFQPQDFRLNESLILRRPREGPPRVEQYP